MFDLLQRGLTVKFGGVTAFTRAPAKGRWKKGEREEQDDILIIEVMTPNLDAAWWRDLRAQLEVVMRQQRILLRAHEVRRL